MPKYIIAKKTVAEYLVEDADTPEEARKVLSEDKAKCIGYQELIDIEDTEHPRRRQPPAAPPTGGNRGVPIKLPAQRPK